MANPWAGEVVLHVDGEPRVCRLTLGVLAELEVELGAQSLSALIAHFEGDSFSARDVMALLGAGLRGGSWRISPGELATARIEGGPLEAAAKAAELLALAFAPASSTNAQATDTSAQPSNDGRDQSDAR